VIRKVDASALSDGLVNKSQDAALTYLQTSLARLGYKTATISVSPAFFSNLPLRADHIQIRFLPVSAKSVPNK